MNNKSNNNESQEYNNRENNNMSNNNSVKTSKKDFRLIAICISSLILIVVFLVCWAIKSFTIAFGTYCFLFLIILVYLFSYFKENWRNFLRALICCSVLQGMGLVIFLVMRPFWADFMYVNKETDQPSLYALPLYFGGLFLFVLYVGCLDLFCNERGAKTKAKSKCNKNNINNNDDNTSDRINNNNVFGESLKKNEYKSNDNSDPFN